MTIINNFAAGLTSLPLPPVVVSIDSSDNYHTNPVPLPSIRLFELPNHIRVTHCDGYHGQEVVAWSSTVSADCQSKKIRDIGDKLIVDVRLNAFPGYAGPDVIPQNLRPFTFPNHPIPNRGFPFTDWMAATTSGNDVYFEFDPIQYALGGDALPTIMFEFHSNMNTAGSGNYRATVVGCISFFQAWDFSTPGTVRRYAKLHTFINEKGSDNWLGTPVDSITLTWTATGDDAETAGLDIANPNATLRVTIGNHLPQASAQYRVNEFNTLPIKQYG